MIAVLKKIAYYYPFSVLGTLLFVADCLLIGSLMQAANPVNLLATSALSLLLLSLVVLARTLALRLKGLLLTWETHQPLLADDLRSSLTFYLKGLRLWPFFYLHFRLTGSLQVGKKARLWIFEEQPLIPDQDGKATYQIYFPLAGKFKAQGQFILRDLLGLCRIRLREAERRELAILPATFLTKPVTDVVTNQGFEESLRKRVQDEERYFMREYVPGDRLRDINWKATARLAKLITRVTPLTQEKTQAVVVFWRNLCSQGKESLESIVVLNRLKSLLFSFLLQFRQEGRECVFQVYCARDSYLLETEEEIWYFAQALAGMSLEPYFNLNTYDQNLSEFFVFTSTYDTELGFFLNLFPKAKSRVVQVCPVAKVKDQTAITRYRFFDPFRASILPGGFILNRKRNLATSAPLAGPQLSLERDLMSITLW